MKIAISDALRSRVSIATLLLIATVWLSYAYRLDRNPDLSIPFDYSGGDEVAVLFYVKSIMDHGWYFENRALAAPFGLEMYDFPNTGILHFLLIRFMALFTEDPFRVLNLAFLATFPLTIFTAFWFFGLLKISPIPSLSGATLFALLPYHFYRGESHFFLSCYYTLPLGMMISWIVYQNAPPLLKDFHPHLKKFSGEAWFVAGASILVGISGAYYTYFTVLMILLSGLMAALRDRRPSPLLTSAAISAGIAFIFILALLPNWLHIREHGRNPESALRPYYDAEAYGLKPIQLLLPVEDHHWKPLNRIKRNYVTAHPPLLNENNFASLGVIGSVGFLILLAHLLLRNSAEPLYFLSRIGLFALLFGVIGGFGSMIAFWVTPQFRAFNRISVVIGLVAIASVSLLLDGFRKRYGFGEARAVYLAIPLLLIGLIDQHSPQFVPDYERIGERLQNDREFVRSIETGYPPNTAIFQIPVMKFPEAEPIRGIASYDSMTPYLHSTSLRWSFGAMEGRSGFEWQRRVADMDVDSMLRELKRSGFGALYIDRAGYANGAKDKIDILRRVLKGEPISDASGRRVIFDIRGYGERG
jgi:phosphoglycerol transferase